MLLGLRGSDPFPVAFFYFLWPQAWSLIPLPEVYTLCVEGGGIRTRVTVVKLAALPRYLKG
jgi:hypothetical protein